MEGLSLILLSIIYFYAGYRYVRDILASTTAPAIGTWIVFVCATLLNVLSVFSVTSWEFVSNAYSLGDFLMCVIILGSLLKRSTIKLERFERIYLIVAGIIVCFWVFSKNAFATNLLVQTLILVGYFPTLHKLIRTKENHESFTNWILFLLAGAIAFYPAYQHSNVLAMIYSVRTIFIISFMLFLMKKYTKKTL